MIIRGRRPVPPFKLIKSNPPRRYCTPKKTHRLSIPTGRWSDIAGYIAEFSTRNNFKPSHFIVQKELVLA